MTITHTPEIPVVVESSTRLNSPFSRLWSVNLGHAVNDMFMGMGAVVLTFLSGALGIGSAQIGLADSLRQLVGAVSQPFFGWLADKTGGRVLGAGGVFWTVSVMMLALVLAVTTGNYWLMLVPYALSALGSGAFHPVGSLHAAEANRQRQTSNTAWFFLAGQLGLAVGPALAGQLLANSLPLITTITAILAPQITFMKVTGVAPIFLLGLLVLPAALWMGLALPSPSQYRSDKQAARVKAAPVNTIPADEPSLLSQLRAVPLTPFLLLAAVVALRGLAQPGSATFIPALFNSKGWNAGEYGLITSSYWLAGAVTGVWFGSLADRFDRRVIVGLSLIASAPFFALLPLAETPLIAVLLSGAAGALSGGSHSVIVTVAQEFIPRAKAFASGSILGMIFGTGALGSLILGALAQAISLPSAFVVVAVTVAISGLLSFALPKRVTR